MGKRADADDADAGRDPLLGRTLGEFLLRQRLRGGSSAMVYRAEQLGLGREAVVKVLSISVVSGDNADGDDTRRFIRAARLAARLNHPYAAHVYAFGHEPDGLLWMAMELVDGVPLDELLRGDGPLPLPRFVPLFDQICEVVQSAHDLGIVHRDLKPANVMVRSNAGRLFPKLLDFGLAKWFGGSVIPPMEDDFVTPVGLRLPPGWAESRSLDEDYGETTDADAGGGGGRFGRVDSSSAVLTGDRVLLGSPVYMAPEQWADSSMVDFRADLYALAVLAYEAITGRVPFSGASLAELAGRHGVEAVPRLGESFPPALDQVMYRALAKLPWERHGSALELAAAFRHAALSGT